MTLEEAIKHCEETAKRLKIEYEYYDHWDEEEEIRANECLECAKEHEQLAAWLRQYAEIKRIVEHWNDKSSSFVSACNAFEDILKIFGRGVKNE